MPDIQIAANESRKAGVKRMKKHPLRVDMTPMVDLGFLLISFFVITTELSKPKAMNLYMPFDGDSTPVAISKSITFLIGEKNKLYYYLGEEKDAGTRSPVNEISWDEKEGVGKIIIEKQAALVRSNFDSKELVVLIKPTKRSTYKNVVDLLDEMTIHQVTRYAVVNPTERETALTQ